ncbi:MAG: HAD-IC family P-type ATPase [Nanoarchaeota archaeon]|nr:HAD-IC family P-type ATPase [Nanoarchaeota archaeon]
MDFCGKGVNEVFELLKTSEQGLSNSEVEERLKKFGHNILVEKKKESLFHKFLMQFTDMLVIILIIAAVISFFLGEYTDGSVILFIVVLNAFIGFFQEFKAERALEALKAMIHPVAVVMRGGQKKEISVGDLVPGDIIVLEEGAKIPADARVFDVAELRCDEAILTGESTPQHKSVDAIEGVYISPADMDNMVFMGTAVTHGRGRAIVVNTGMKTEFGKIAGLTANIEEEKSPLKKELFNVGKFIAKATLVTCLLIFLFGLISGNGLFEMFMFAVSLAVAAVPEGLPATVTIALALGVQRMAKKKAIIRKLASVETLGSTTVICSDKTGTITKNEMTVTEVFVDDTVISVAGSGYIPEGDFSSESHNLSYLLQASVLCNDSSLNRSDDDVWKVLGDPTEGALVVAALKKGLNVDSLRDSYKRIFEIPFDSSRKMMTTINESAEQKTAFVKGAPDFILSNCSKININGEIVDMSS